MSTTRFLQVCLASLCCACAAPQMQVPNDVAASTEALPMSGAEGAQSNGFVFGGYQLIAIERQDGKELSNEDELRTAYAFELQAGSAKTSGRCESQRARVETLTKTAVWGSLQLSCECQSPGERARLTVQSVEKGLSGRFQLDHERYSVHSLHDTTALQGGFSAAGYRIDAEAGPVGAVDIVGRPGTIWLGRELPDERKLSVGCALAGLYLFKEPGSGP